MQRFRMKEILAELKRRGVFAVVGGPWVTVQEDYFERAGRRRSSSARPRRPGRGSWATGSRGQHAARYEQAEKSDMSPVPTPRFDLLKMRHYLFGSLQFSRGCPFQCEFCDIIVTFGRRPRIKTVGPDPRRAGRPARPGDGDRLHRRRQSDRQQEGHQAGAPRGHRLAGGTRLPADLLSPRRRSTWPTTRS